MRTKPRTLDAAGVSTLQTWVDEVAAWPDDGLAKVSSGLTSIEELARVVST